MASPAARRIAAAPVEQPLPPDEILEGIFLRIDSGYDLARASATCRAFRRVATGRPFLRRFLSLHPPPIIGFIDFAQNRGLYLAEPPHRSAQAARAVSLSGDFTFSFLPGASDPNSRWCICDARDGRFLLSRESTDASTFLELVVCDPLYRRYVQIPHVPGDLLRRTPPSDEMKSEPFLAPEEESKEVSHFRVIYNWLSNYRLVSFVFSAATGKWCYATTFSFLPAGLIRQPKKCVRYYARSCFYWVYKGEGYMLKLDIHEMKFSLVELLHYNKDPHKRGVAIIDAPEDRLGLLTIRFPRIGGLYTRGLRTLDLYSRSCQENGAGEEEWRLDKSIPLPEPDYGYSIIGAAEGYLLLQGSPDLSSLTGPKAQCFAVDLKTLLVERLCTLNAYTSSDAQPYASFPPPLSLPSL